MAKQTKVELTKSKLELEGVQVTFRVDIGDWRKYVSISPIDFKVFKKWADIYAPSVVESIVEDIENQIQSPNKPKKGK